MRIVWLTNCHRCESKSTVVSGRNIAAEMVSVCGNCKYKWSTYDSYVADHKAENGTGLGPYPTSVSLPDECIGLDGAGEYIDSGDFTAELDKVVKFAGHDAVMRFVDRLEYEVRQKIVQSFDSDTLPDKILDVIRERRRQAKDDWNCGD